MEEARGPLAINVLWQSDGLQGRSRAVKLMHEWLDGRRRGEEEAEVCAVGARKRPRKPAHQPPEPALSSSSSAGAGRRGPPATPGSTPETAAAREPAHAHPLTTVLRPVALAQHRVEQPREVLLHRRR